MDDIEQRGVVSGFFHRQRIRQCMALMERDRLRASLLQQPWMGCVLPTEPSPTTGAYDQFLMRMFALLRAGSVTRRLVDAHPSWVCERKSREITIDHLICVITGGVVHLIPGPLY